MSKTTTSPGRHTDWLCEVHLLKISFISNLTYISTMLSKIGSRRLYAPIGGVLKNLVRRNFCEAATVEASKLAAKAVTHDNSSSEIKVAWNNNEITRLPFVFLRDNCRCSTCFHETSDQSLVLIHDALREAEAGVDNVSFHDDSLVIRWASGHESSFSLSWLKERSYTDEKAYEKRKHAITGFRNILWSKEHQIKFIDFESANSNDDALLQWMTIMATEGVAVLQDAPKEPNQLRKLVHRACGGLRNTMYGDIFTVKEKPNATNLAYTSGYLALHTDQPYYATQPDIQFLHCIVASPPNEGVNHLVDGFKVATDLRENHPDDFKILSTLTVPYQQRGSEMYSDFILEADQTVIGLNQYGEIDRISHNYPSRESSMNHPAAETKAFYKSLGKFVAMMYDPKYLLAYKLEAGDILGFHNKRVLHGRTPYDPSRSERWLEGAYANWDDVHARIRALKERLGK